MKRTLIGAVCAAASLAASSSAMAAEQVNIGAPAWTGAQAIAHLIKEVVEGRIGGQANLVPGNNASIFQAMDQGRGDIDVHPDVWLPNQESFTKKYVDGAGTVVLSDKYYEGKQSFCVARDFAEQNNVTSVFDLARPEVAELMDSDGNGKGEIYGCPEDWTCDDIFSSNIAFAGWDNIEQTQAGYDAMFAEFLDKAVAGEPAAIYTWTPTAYLAQAIPGETTLWLSMANDSVLDDSNPTGVEGGADYSQRRDDGTVGYTGLGPDTCTQGPDGCQLGWLAADIEITANKAWADENPAAEALFEVFKPPLIDLAIAGVALSNSDGSQADVEAIATQWIADNRALADEWVAAALAAA